MGVRDDNFLGHAKVFAVWDEDRNGNKIVKVGGLPVATYIKEQKFWGGFQWRVTSTMRIKSKELGMFKTEEDARKQCLKFAKLVYNKLTDL